MKNCLVLAGEYRTFDKTADSIAQFAEINELDVYCHIWTESSEEVENIINKLKPAAIRSQSAAKHKKEFLSIEKRIREKNPKGPNTDKVWQNASMNFSRKAAFNLVPLEEYDNIVFARYDLNFLTSFRIGWNDGGIATAFAESWGLISDVFAVMPSKFANHFFLYEEYEKLHSTPFEDEFIEFLRHSFKYGEENIRIQRDERYCPHMILIRNFFLNQIPWGVTHFPVALQR